MMINQYFTYLRNLIFEKAWIVCLASGLFSCSENGQKDSLFQKLDPTVSGIDFSNQLSPSSDFNIFKYLYYYNGAGVAAGDLNGDSLVDLFFTANQDKNRLYLNQGELKFKDITDISKVGGDAEAWSTGVCFADVSGDGKLDIYVSEMGNYQGVFGRNHLYINQGNDSNGVPQFKEEAVAYGLDLVGFSTQAAFFDYDLDGDLDMYMLNHSVHSNGTFEPRTKIRDKKHALAGDKLLRNDEGKFVDVSQESGIYSSALGYGLGISTGDLNEDGYPDIYIGNDFHENDYLYINNQDGTFREVLRESIQHTSRFSMGNDMGDLNQDGLLDILSLDMLPADYEILKASAAEDEYDVFNYKLKYGYNHQFARNSLQLNQGNLKFSEVGALCNIYATDWSWSALIADYDLDGLKDIFISNGIKRRSNDLDYIRYISSDAIQIKLRGQLNEQDLALVDSMPVIKIPNFLYRNQGNLKFQNMASEWDMDLPSFSSGATYADLDNDGDLEIITNNTDDPAGIYKNLSREKAKADRHYLKIQFQGEGKNRFGIGCQIRSESSQGIIRQEMYTTRGFQSSVSPEMFIGLGKDSLLKRLTVIWPDLSFQVLENVKADQVLSLKQSEAQGKYDFSTQKESGFLLEDISEDFALDYSHKENRYVEFNRQTLIPYMVSNDGPALAVGDVNGDGLDDFYVGGAKHQRGRLYAQSSDGFELLPNPVFRIDSLSEDIEAAFVDLDQDKDLDLVVLSGGNEFRLSGKEKEPNRPRLYLNDGAGNFEKKADAFPSEVAMTGAALAFCDFDQDGDQDLFMGGRSVPWKFGEIPNSYLLQNDGKGKFTDITDQVAGLRKLGMVRAAEWGDVNGNGQPDLVVAGEWFPIAVFNNQGGKLNRMNPKGLAQSHGWWNTIRLIDIDQDGDLDILGGNLGLNSKLKADSENPLRLAVRDFDQNGSLDQLLLHNWQGKEQLFATKDELGKQLVALNKKFVSYREFSKASLKEIIEPAEFAKADILETYELRSCLFINDGQGAFIKEALPQELQISPIYSFSFLDANQDGRDDIFAFGNFYENNIQMGRYDASYGHLMWNRKDGDLEVANNRAVNLYVDGQVRRSRKMRFQNRSILVLARNNDSLRFIALDKADPGLN